MGGKLTSAKRRLSAKSTLIKAADQPQILVLGLEKSGKTTLLYKLKLGDHWNAMKMPKELASMRTPQKTTAGKKEKDKKDDKDKEFGKVEDAGYHFEEFKRVLDCGLWDVPGTPAMRQTWSIFYRAIKVHGVIFVVGCEDKLVERQQEEHLLSKEAQNMDPVELANKRKELERARRYTLDRRREAKKALHILLNEDELSHAAFAVILNQRRNGARGGLVPSNEDDELEYRLGLRDLGEAMKGRVQSFMINLNEIQREDDTKFKDVWQFFKDHFRRVGLRP